MNRSGAHQCRDKVVWYECRYVGKFAPSTSVPCSMRLFSLLSVAAGVMQGPWPIGTPAGCRLETFGLLLCSAVIGCWSLLRALVLYVCCSFGCGRLFFGTFRFLLRHVSIWVAILTQSSQRGASCIDRAIRLICWRVSGAVL